MGGASVSFSFFPRESGWILGKKGKKKRIYIYERSRSMSPSFFFGLSRYIYLKRGSKAEGQFVLRVEG
jgi:hypothetical protein